MVHILNKPSRNRIHDQLMYYFSVILSLGVALILCTLCFQLVTVQKYDNIVEQNLMLDSFYSGLKQQEKRIEEYWAGSTSGSGEEELILAEFEEMQKILKNLQYQKNQAYNREIHDMKEIIKSEGVLFGTLVTKMQEFRQNLNNTSMLKEVNDIYFEINEIYEILYNDFEYLRMDFLENSELIKESLTQKTIIYVCLLLAAVATLIISGLIQAKKLTTQVSEPILALAHSSEMILDGKLQEFEKLPVSGEADSEITILTNAFNLMIEQLRAYISEVEQNAQMKVALIEKDVENLRINNLLKNSELKVLQMQINPHFLFNTLNMISQTAYMGDADTTVFLLRKTADLLRYSLSSVGKSVTLAKELSMLGDYIYLQEQRMGDRISFEFELDERFHDILVPALILQPLVENAVVHGVGTYTENGRIWIRTRYDEKNKAGVITISDNGEGISERRIREIQEELKSQKMQQEKVGVANVYMRIQLMYDQKAQMHISSIPREKTEIQLILPYGQK